MAARKIPTLQAISSTAVTRWHRQCLATTTYKLRAGGRCSCTSGALLHDLAINQSIMRPLETVDAEDHPNYELVDCWSCTRLSRTLIEQRTCQVICRVVRNRVGEVIVRRRDANGRRSCSGHSIRLHRDSACSWHLDVGLMSGSYASQTASRGWHCSDYCMARPRRPDGPRSTRERVCQGGADSINVQSSEDNESPAMPCCPRFQRSSCQQ